MNGFISKYRWIIVIVAGGLAAALFYYNKQDPEPVAVLVEETTEAEVIEDTVPEPSPEPEPEDVTEPEIEETEEAATEPTSEDAPVEAEPAAEPVEEEVSAIEPVVEDEPVVEVEPEPEVSEPTPEASTPEEAVVDEPVAEEPAVEEFPTEEAVEEPIAEPADEPVEEPAPVESPAEPSASDEPAAEEPVEESTEKTTEAEAVVEELADAITQTSEEETTEEGIKPSFDVVRVDPTGSAVIAGSAEPFSKVVITSNGEEIGEAIAGGSGEFVAIIQVPENEEGQTLELESEVSGQLLFSDETILILPIMRSTAADTVTEESAPPIIRATEDEFVIIQGGAQLALGQVSLDSISYDENDEVVLAGRGNPGRTVIIYVDDTPLMDTVVSESGSWKQALHGLDAGRYVLRVDEIDDDGNVTSRVESPFQREYPEDVREAKASSATTYTVQPGNSLWIIATGRYGEGMRYHQIFSANKDQIRDPDLIYPGQVFSLPEMEE